jgi:hypothetical protein
MPPAYERYPEIKNTRWVGGDWEITAVKISDHPAHSPDLTSSDFHLFLHLEKHLAGQKFHEN